MLARFYPKDPSIITITYIYLLTYSAEQSSSSESNQFSASQEIPCIVRKLTVHYRMHKKEYCNPFKTLYHIGISSLAQWFN